MPSETLSEARNRAFAVVCRVCEVVDDERGCVDAQKDKQCGVEIPSGTSASLPPYEGNVTWHIGENVPQATYFVRAYSMCGETKCAFGNSTGYFQVAPARGPLVRLEDSSYLHVEGCTPALQVRCNCRKHAEEMRKSQWRSYNDACDQGRKCVDAHVCKHAPCTYGHVH